MAVILHQSTPFHSHSHHYAAGYEELENSRVDEHSSHPNHLGNTSVRAAFIHVIGDLFQSIGVFVAATIIFFKVSAFINITLILCIISMSLFHCNKSNVHYDKCHKIIFFDGK